MKQIFTLFFIFVLGNVNAQKIPANVIIVDEKTLYESVDTTCWQQGRLWIADLICEQLIYCKHNTIELAFSNCDPDADEAVKDSVRKAMSLQVDRLVELSSCGPVANLAIFVGEGVYLSKKELTKKDPGKLNMERFKKLYGAKLGKAYPNQKVFVLNWLW